MNVSSVGGLVLGDGGVFAARDVHLQPPRVTAALASGRDVVDEGLELSECEFRRLQTAGIEVVVLRIISESSPL